MVGIISRISKVLPRAIHFDIKFSNISSSGSCCCSFSLSLALALSLYLSSQLFKSPSICYLLMWFEFHSHTSSPTSQNVYKSNKINAFYCNYNLIMQECLKTPIIYGFLIIIDSRRPFAYCKDCSQRHQQMLLYWQLLLSPLRGT